MLELQRSQVVQKTSWNLIAIFGKLFAVTLCFLSLCILHGGVEGLVLGLQCPYN